MKRILAGKRLEQELNERISQTTGTVSYLVARIDDEEETGLIAAAGEAEIHSSASMIKLLIMECLFAMARQEKLDLTATVPLSAAPRVEGGGALQELFSYHRFSLLELCRLMMVLSDNWATNLLIRQLGMEQINQRAQELGLANTRLQRFMMDVRAIQEGRENLTTAADLLILLEHLYHLREEPQLGQEMWHILGRQQFRDKLPFFWGEDVPFYHKTGCLDRVEHDGGIWLTMQGAYGLIFLASELPDNASGIRLLSELGLVTRDFLMEALP